MSITRRAPVLPEPADLHVRITPMRRRHLRSVLRIEDQVYPRPWSIAVFHESTYDVAGCSWTRGSSQITNPNT